MSEESTMQFPKLARLIAFGSIAIILGATLYVFSRDHEHVPEGKYVGSEYCRKCHLQQYQSWATTRMAQTFDVLKPGVKPEEKKLAGLNPEADYTRDPACLPCHTTAYGRTGGFVSIEETPQMAGIGCEQCHGPGGVYADTVMARDPNFTTEEARMAGLVYPPKEWVCVNCHNDKSPFVGMDYKFDFSDRVKRGTHQHFQLKYSHVPGAQAPPG